MEWDEEGECALVICPALRTEFAVKLPAGGGHPTNSPVAIGSKWQVFASNRRTTVPLTE